MSVIYVGICYGYEVWVKHVHHIWWIRHWYESWEKSIYHICENVKKIWLVSKIEIYMLKDMIVIHVEWYEFAMIIERCWFLSMMKDMNCYDFWYDSRTWLHICWNVLLIWIVRKIWIYMLLNVIHVRRNETSIIYEECAIDMITDICCILPVWYITCCHVQDMDREQRYDTEPVVMCKTWTTNRDKQKCDTVLFQFIACLNGHDINYLIDRDIWIWYYIYI